MTKGRHPNLNSAAEKMALRFLPPVVTRALKNAFGAVHFSGDFPTWQDAQQKCEGYGANQILERVKESALAVKEGRARYERDSKVFYEKAYEWPMLSCLLWAAVREGGSLSVLDFGGSLGSRYYQHRPWLTQMKRVRWSVVEQPGFVRVGQEQFQDDVLRFYPDVPSCVAAEAPNVLHISCVLQYLEQPYEVLDQLLGVGFKAIILDRTALIEGPRDRLTVQRVGKSIYPASYPAWFFSRARLLEAFSPRYRLVEDFDTADKANLPRTKYQGFLFERTKT